MQHLLYIFNVWPKTIRIKEDEMVKYFNKYMI